MSKKIECKKCGIKHNQILENCTWINCDCGEEICGSCGGLNISRIDNIDMSDESDSHYWCCLECDDCGNQGCAMCV